MVRVVDWGRREYVESLAAMRALRTSRSRGEVEDTLILVEHPPVVTVGVEGDDGAATATGLPVVHVERGGRATYHGPGQLVGYPVVDLSARGRDVRRFVRDVESVVVLVLRAWGIRAEHVPQRHGVWVGGGARKIASVGIAVEGWVTFHGFALNVSTDLAEFERFHPCGFDGRIMTNMTRELGRPITVAEVSPEVIRAWANVFDQDSVTPLTPRAATAAP